MYYTHFLFELGDGERWLIASKEAVIGEHYKNDPRPIVASSDGRSNYKARWYNRRRTEEDPLVSINDHHDCVCLKPEDMVYAEKSWPSGRECSNGNDTVSPSPTSIAFSMKNHNGANVYLGKLKLTQKHQLVFNSNRLGAMNGLG